MAAGTNLCKVCKFKVRKASQGEEVALCRGCFAKLGGVRTQFTRAFGGSVLAAATPRPDVPDLIEPIVGWRRWAGIYDEKDTRLLALVYPDEWKRGENRARCAAHEAMLAIKSESPPACTAEHMIDCNCGFFAFKEAEMGRLFSSPYGDEGEGAVPYGRVALYGTVIEHEFGWRASHARVLSCSLPRVAEAYGVEVETREIEVAPQEMKQFLVTTYTHGDPSYTISWATSDGPQYFTWSKPAEALGTGQLSLPFEDDDNLTITCDVIAGLEHKEQA